MKLEDALDHVVGLAMAAHAAFAEERAHIEQGDEALAVVKDYLRRSHGMSFDGDDVLGNRDPADGDEVLFFNLHTEIKAFNRGGVLGPIKGRVIEVTDGLHDHPELCYRVQLHDAVDRSKQTKLSAGRDELQILPSQP